MSYAFEKLSQLTDQRNNLTKKGNYSKRRGAITTRVWHHSLTRKDLAGSTAAGFARYHVQSLGWPGIGYTFVIEPCNLVDTPNGKRARIVYCHDIDRRTYHVGNSNQFSLGICVAGDYRTDDLDEPTRASIAELHAALVADKIGNDDKSHHEMPGYSWKACCVFDYKKVFNSKSGSTSSSKPSEVPSTYTIQEGDTFWSIAHKNSATGVTVDDLIETNPDVDPTKLQVGQVINFAKHSDNGGTSSTQSKSSNSNISNKKRRTLRLTDPYTWGDDVREAQRGVRASVDGIFGPQTDQKVRAFQRSQRLTVDGIVGPKTWSAIDNPKSKPQYRRLISLKTPYMRGDDVKHVQSALKVKVDGIYGPISEGAVRNFQSAQKITVDGIVGPQTWVKLLR